MRRVPEDIENQRKWTGASGFAALLGALLCLSISTHASAQNSGRANGASADSAQILSELEAIIEQGERNNSADPNFMAALRDLLRRNTWPWQRILLDDTFADGNFTSNPRWTNTSGNVVVDPNRGLVMLASTGRVNLPPIFVPSNPRPVPNTGDVLSSARDWNGASDRFAFQPNGGISNVSSGNSGGTIAIFGSGNGGGIRSNEAISGDFTFHYTAGNNDQVRVGLYAASQDAQFRPFEGRRENETSGLTAMSKAWWIKDGSQIMQGPVQVGTIDITPGDRVEFRREDNAILITVNAQIAHVYDLQSVEPLRSIVNYFSGRRFFLDGVGWSTANGPAPDTGDDLETSSSDAWFGAVGDFVYRRAGIVGRTAGRAIGTQNTFADDFVFRATIGRSNSPRSLRVGLYEADEDFNFDPNSGLGGLERMRRSWYFADGQLVSGNQVVASNIRLRDGAEIEFNRVGRRISVTVDGQQIHTFQRRSNAPLRAIIAHSSRPGTLDLQRVAWSRDGFAGGGAGGGTGGVFEPPIAEDARLEARLFITNAFAIETTLISQNRRGGELEIGLMRRRDEVGYRLALSPGRPQTIEVIRSDRRGDTIIASAVRNGTLNDGRPHDVLFTRGINGLMSVSVDDIEWINVMDQSVTVPFDAISLNDRRGEFVITSVTAYGL